MQRTQSPKSPRSSRGGGGAEQSNAGGGMKEGLRELFLTNLKDIYYAEKQILKTLPRMAKAASSVELKEVFETHRDQTTGQIERLEEIFRILGERAQGVTCEAIEGIIAEGKEIMEDFKGQEVLDVGLVGAAKAVEHYEMARYESLITLAESLGMSDAEALLQQNLAEEEEADELLENCCEELLEQAT